MKIELKSIHHFPSMSEETPCFDAVIWIDGVKACRVSNHGQGAPDCFDDHQVEAKLNAYGATLPDHVTDFPDLNDPSKKFTMKQNAESLVGDLLEEHLKAQDAKKERAKFERDLKTRALYTKQGEKGIFETRKLTPIEFMKWLPNVETAHRCLKGSDKILNLLPIAEAWKIFQANIERVVR